MEDKEDRVYVDTTPIVSNAIIMWDEIRNRRFEVVDWSKVPLWVKVRHYTIDKVMRLIPLKIRLKSKSKMRELNYWFCKLPYRLPRMIRGIGWRIKNTFNLK